MRNILRSEWTAMAAELAAEAERRHPAVGVASRTPGEIRIETPSISGTIEARAASRDGFSIAFHVGSSSCVTGGVSGLIHHATNAQRVAECAAWIEARTDGLTVWFGDAPCDFCGARGESMGAACKRCDGTGRRTDSAT